MPKRTWSDGVLGNTPLSAARLNQLEDDLDAACAALARTPDALWAGAVTVDANGAPISAVVEWPDRKEDGSVITGTYSGTASTTFPGSIDSYTITRIINAGTVTYTQPAVTRNANGQITNRPAITVS